MPETTPLYPEMNVREYLHFRAELKRVPRAKRAGAVAQAMQDAGLGGVEATLIGQLSKGYRQRVGLADALVASPPLLILDEPTAGLDPNQIREVRTLIGRLRERHTVLLSTHILSEVEATCTRGIVIARGELVASGTLSELHALRRARRVRLRVRGEGSDAAGKLVSKVKGVSGVDALAPTPEGHARYVASFEDPDRGDDITESIVRALTEARIGVLEVTPQSSLEEVFSELTSTTAEAE
jgi:ABC-2 type transport system ATP-binding protein